MTRLEIFIPNRSPSPPPRIGEFILSAEGDRHVLYGRPLTPEEFNKEIDRFSFQDDNIYRRPTCRVTVSDPEPTQQPPEEGPAPESPAPLAVEAVDTEPQEEGPERPEFAPKAKGRGRPKKIK